MDRHKAGNPMGKYIRDNMKSDIKLGKLTLGEYLAHLVEQVNPTKIPQNRVPQTTFCILDESETVAGMVM